MKYILCQPAIKRFEWELQVCLTNMIKTNRISSKNIILLFSKHDDDVPKHLKAEYGIETHVYRDDRDDKRYIPSIKPYLWWKFLEENPKRQSEMYFYMDSDVIFRRVPRPRGVKPDRWLCSDCNGYLNLDYIKSRKHGDKIIDRMCQIIGVTRRSIETINNNSGGAQWVIKNPTAAYWKKVYNDSTKLYRYFKSIDTDLQKWTAEMWSQLWNMMYFNIGPQISKELNFCWATDDVKRWNEVKIYHNAGVTADMKDLFFKGKYTSRTPFDDDLSFVDKNKAQIKYIEAIKKVSR